MKKGRVVMDIQTLLLILFLIIGSYPPHKMYPFKEGNLVCEVISAAQDLHKNVI